MPGESYEDILRGVVALPDTMQCTLADFALRLRTCILRELQAPSPDTALIAVLCDAARLGHEHGCRLAILVGRASASSASSAVGS